MSVLIAALASMVFSMLLATDQIIAHQEPIHSLKDNFNQELFLVIGSGGGTSNLRYHFYVETEQGLEYRAINAYDAFLKYSSTNEAVFEIHEHRHSTLFLGLGWFINDWSPAKISYVIQVPEGSITRDYQIDLQ